MKKHKVTGLSGLVAKTIQATWDTGVQWLTDLCNGCNDDVDKVVNVDAPLGLGVNAP